MILNMTQHDATAEQLSAGVIDPPGYIRGKIRALLTFDALPSAEEISVRAYAIADLAENAADDVAGADPVYAMIGGAPYLMAPLEDALLRVGIPPVYAFSKRESVEENVPDGAVTKRSVFRHIGFVEVAI